MSARKSKIKMSFICNQDWDEMNPSTNGKYCEFCKQEISDFTRYSDKEIKWLGRSKNDLCGRFTVEQVDSELIKPIEFSRPIKVFGFLSALYFSILTGRLFGQNINKQFSEKIEWVDEIKDNDSVSSNCKVISTSTKSRNNPENKKKLVFRTKRKRFYITRRFPFIKIVRVFHVMGKFRI